MAAIYTNLSDGCSCALLLARFSYATTHFDWAQLGTLHVGLDCLDELRFVIVHRDHYRFGYSISVSAKDQRWPWHVGCLKIVARTSHGLTH